MTDRNGKELLVHAQVQFRSNIQDSMLEGTVREIGKNVNFNEDEAKVDDGDPENDDLNTDKFHVAALVSSKNIELLP